MTDRIRLARSADWPLIQGFHREQNEAQGTNYALPNLFTPTGDFAPNIALAFIVERGGVPVSSFYFENVPEMCFAGCDPEATAHVRKDFERIVFGLRALGYTGITCKVPEHVAESIAKPLIKEGFAQDSGLVHFFKDLRMPKLTEE